MPDAAQAAAILVHTARITAAWLSLHPMATEDVPGLILDVRRALTGCVSSETAPPVAAPADDGPAVPLRHSVFADHIVCLECGDGFRTLRKHLRQTHKIEPAAYRAKWGLPSSYPMIAPEYSARRSQLTKDGEMWRLRKRA